MKIKNRRVKIKQIIKYSFVFIVILVSLLMYYMYNYPVSWETVNFGDKRKVVELELGKSAFSDNWDVKGEFWLSKNILFEQQLMIGYNLEKDTIVDHKRILVHFNGLSEWCWSIQNEFKRY